MRVNDVDVVIDDDLRDFVGEADVVRGVTEKGVVGYVYLVKMYVGIFSESEWSFATDDVYFVVAFGQCDGEFCSNDA